MINLATFNPARSTHIYPLPGAYFSGAGAFMDFLFERRQYEAAVQAFANAASPDGIRESIDAARRFGFRLTRGEAREAAADGLRVSLSALGYDGAEIQWHVARRGRRDRHFYFVDELRRRRTH